MTFENATELRLEWIAAYTEMSEHMKPEELPKTRVVARGFGLPGMYAPPPDEDEQDDDPGDDRLFVAHLINGMTRNRCTYCASLNSQFQPIAAYGIKMGLWKMAMEGYLDRIVNEVHDEANYWLYPDELRTHIPIIEKCMIDGMRLACPDVMVKVESSCMLHWDKNAVEFKDIVWDDEGRPVIEEPPFVKEVYGIKETEKETES